MGRTAVVVGGGVGGLAATRALLEPGWDVTVLEQAPTFEPVGAGLAVAPNAVRALDWLGLGDELRARGIAQGAAGIRDASGRWLMRTDITELERRFGVPGFALRRADLHHMLVDAIGQADERPGHHVSSVSQADGQATVTFEGPSGQGSVSADLVVGADGINSRVREDLFPAHPGPSYAGYITWRGLVPADAAQDIELEARLTETWGRGERFGIAPLADGQVYWFATASVPEASHTDDSLADVAARYRTWHHPIPQLLDATPPQALLAHDIHHLDQPLERYVDGRIVLLGDAAHAMTPDLGQGACQALEDAVTLGHAIGTTTDLGAALASYDRDRRPRTQELVRLSARIGRIAQWRNPLLTTVRHLVARAIPASLYLRASTDTFAWTPPSRPARLAS
jgi:2-polyprenyl-6-methoxyphenol hydroxylase-like FAD-dependent oxidoreductase